MSNSRKPHKKKPEFRQVAHVQHHELRSGPLPDAMEMARYDEIMPGAAERIIRMAEREQEFAHNQGARIHNLMLLGTISGALLALIALALAFCMVFTGTPGIASVIWAVAGLVGVAIMGRTVTKIWRSKQGMP